MGDLAYNLVELARSEDPGSAPRQVLRLDRLLRGSRVEIDLGENDLVGSSDGPALLRCLTHPARAHREVRPASFANVERSLRTLAAFARFASASKIEWYLTGGIAVDLVTRAASRLHSDLDIVIPIDQARRLRDLLAASGVGAYRRVLTATYAADRRFTLFKRCSPAQADFGRHRTLMLLMRQGERLLPLVDLHFVLRSSSGLAVLDKRRIVNLPFPLAGADEFSVAGERVRCCDLRLLMYLKSDGREKSRHDARRLARCLSPSDISKIARLRRAPVEQYWGSGSEFACPGPGCLRGDVLS